MGFDTIEINLVFNYIDGESKKLKNILLFSFADIGFL